MQQRYNKLDVFFALDELAAGDTPIHRLHPIVKLTVTIVLIVCVISSGRYDAAGLTVFFFYPVLLIPLAELPFRGVLRRTLPALPFVAFAGISNILFERTLAPIGVSYGLLSCVVLLEKTLLTVSAVVILAATTRSNALFSQMQRLHVPRIVTTTAMLCVRYLSLLASEAASMARAYHLRSVKQQGLEMKHLGAFLGQLLLRSIDRAERVYTAMQCRGFDGTFPAIQHPALRAGSVWYGALVSAALIAARVLNLGGVLNSIGNLF